MDLDPRSNPFSDPSISTIHVFSNGIKTISTEIQLFIFALVDTVASICCHYRKHTLDMILEILFTSLVPYFYGLHHMSKDWILILIFRKGFQSYPPDPQHDLDPDQDHQK